MHHTIYFSKPFKHNEKQYFILKVKIEVFLVSISRLRTQTRTPIFAVRIPF